MDNAGTTPYLPTSQHSAIDCQDLHVFPHGLKADWEHLSPSRIMKVSGVDPKSDPKVQVPPKAYCFEQSQSGIFQVKPLLVRDGLCIFFHFALIAGNIHQALKTDNKVLSFFYAVARQHGLASQHLRSKILSFLLKKIP